FFARMGRLFSGAPTFEGHHDIEPNKYPNSRSYGWIMALEARADGLWGKMTWTPEGREMLQNGAFKSLALTNEPNLPLPPLANQKDHMQTITELLSLPNDATADQIIEATRALHGRVTTLENENQNLRTSAQSADEQARLLANTQSEFTSLNSQFTTMQSQFAAERSARIELLLANAIEK